MLIFKGKKLGILALGVLFGVLGIFTLSTRTVAALDSSPIQPGPPNTSTIWHTVSNGNVSGNGSNLLYAPKVVLKLYSGSNGGFNVTFIDGGQCGTPNDSSGGSGANTTVFRIRGTDGAENPTTSVVSANNAGGCANRDVTIAVPANLSTASTVPGHTTSLGTPVYTFYIAVELSGAAGGSQVNGYLNSFRVRSNLTILSQAEAMAGDAFNGNQPSDHPIALIGRPANDTKNRYKVEFKAPCTLSGGQANIYLKWFDADAGTWYQDTSISWTLRNKDTGAVVETLGGSNLGGEAAYKSERVTISAGVNYEWEWNNVTNRNGVQLWMPFDGTSVEFDCPNTDDPISAECTILSLPTRVDANSTFPVSIRVRNTGTTTWSHTNRLLAAIGGNEFNENSGGTNDNRIYMTGPLAAGASYTFNFSVKAPAEPTPEAIFRWRMIYTNNPPGSQGFGNQCVQGIRVVNNSPYIQAVGNNVYSGAGFGPACTVTDAAKNANITTKGYYSKQDVSVRDSGFSGSQYAVFASGSIGESGSDFSSNTFLGNFGYNRSSIPNVKDGLFANSSHNVSGEDEEATSEYGYFYDGSTSGLPCVSPPPSLTNATPIATQAAALSFLRTGSGVRAYETDLSIDGATLNVTGSKRTLIVNGNVTISAAITYGSSGSYTTTNDVPYLRIIAKNIFIESGVTTIDAHLVADPTLNTADPASGLIDTCASIAGGGVWPSSLTTGSCPTKLTVNGSLTARRILWKRTIGTLGDNLTASDPACYYNNNPINTDAKAARLQQCAAELIKFSPEAYLANFSEDLSIGTVPTSSRELPPVY